MLQLFRCCRFDLSQTQHPLFVPARLFEAHIELFEGRFGRARCKLELAIVETGKDLSRDDGVADLEIVDEIEPAAVRERIGELVRQRFTGEA